jgi:hypothetical protein
MAVFQTDEDRRCYLQFLGEEAGRFGVEILAWCLMIGVAEKEVYGNSENNQN